MKSITRRFRSHLSFANVMATIAVFIALGGTSYAAVMITGADVQDESLTGRDVRDSSLGASDVINNSLGTGEIRNESLTGRDVRDSSLGSSDVIDGSLLARDFRAGQLQPGPKGDQGPAGPAGGATSRFFLLDETGTIVEQSGGFTVVSKPGSTGQVAGDPNVYVRSTTSLVNKGLSATIAIQNLVDRTGDKKPNPAFAGDAAVGRCATTGAVNCVPTGTDNANTLVVRALADNNNVASETRRVYVHVTP